MRTSCSDADAAALRDQQTKIEFALAALDGAEAQVAKVSLKRNQSQINLIRDWAEFDPLEDEQLSDRAAVRVEIQTLDLWLTNPPVLRRAADALTRELADSKPLIRATAQSRSSPERTPAECFWMARLVQLESAPFENRIHALRQIATEVLGDLRVLISAKRGAELNPDEKRTGIFQRGLGLGNRPLTFEERQAGVAFE